MRLPNRISRVFFDRYAEPSAARRKKSYPHQVLILIERKLDYQEVTDWCENHLTHRYTMTARYGDLRDDRLDYMLRDPNLKNLISAGKGDPYFTYWFQTPEDAFAFKMRWG
ncbi:MAG: hypothetical protein EOP84_12680 [Verrucomicrobiaceae bacterium]|nr:MAG: hypothetical protein EOP84_12680 [Verrucomicrobiaceae bacterium]